MLQPLLKDKRGFLFLLLLTLLPILIFSISKVLETRKRAGIVALPFRVEISFHGCPMLTDLEIGNRCYLSALVYDYYHHPFFNGFEYSWHVSSTGSLVDLSHTEGPVTDFLVKGEGIGDLFVVARPKSPGILIAPITASLPIRVGLPKSCPTECRARGYVDGYCSASRPVIPSPPFACNSGDIDIGQTKDCSLTIDLIGVFRSCCCRKIGPTPTGSCQKQSGDLNCDRRVDINDLVIVGSNFGTSNSQADANGDGKVDIADLVIVGVNFGKIFGV